MAARFSIIYDITQYTSNGCSLNTMNVMHSTPLHTHIHTPSRKVQPLLCRSPWDVPLVTLFFSFCKQKKL